MTWQPQTAIPETAIQFDGSQPWMPKTAQPDIQDELENKYLKSSKEMIYANPAATTAAYLGNAAQGAPVIGPFTDEPVSAAFAALGAGEGQNFGERYSDMQERQAALRQAGKEQNPESTTVGQVGAGVAGLKAVPMLPRVGAVAGAPGLATAANLAGGAAQGAGYGALYGYGAGSGVDDRMNQAGAGAKLGAILGLGTSSAGEVFDALGKGLKVTQPQESAIKLAEKLDVPIYKSQVSDNKPYQVLTSVMKDIPFSGAAARSEGQQKSMNAALAKTIGIKANELPPDVVEATRASIGKGLEDINLRNTLKVTNDFMDEIKVVQDAANKRLVPGDATVVNNFIQDIKDKIVKRQIEGEAYQGFRTELGRMGKSGGDKSFYLSELKRVLDRGFSSGLTGADASAANTLRGQYSSAKNIQPLSEANPSGDIPIAQINRSAKRGTRELKDVGRLGQYLKDKIPTSGTAERNMMMQLMGGAAGLGGTAFLGQQAGIPPEKLLASLALAGALSKPANQLINPRVTSASLQANPELQALAELLRKQSAMPSAFEFGGQ